jgi:hypothetical protein
VDSPVMLPPGWERLAMNPVETGSESLVMTMGIVEVASLAARVAAGPAVTMMSALKRTSSAARSGSRSGFPSAHRHYALGFGAVVGERTTSTRRALKPSPILYPGHVSGHNCRPTISRLTSNTAS